jgi:hypothetical protein
MGGKQSVPKITPQDRAILEFEWSLSLLAFMLTYFMHAVSNYNEINLDSIRRKQEVASLHFISFFDIQLIASFKLFLTESMLLPKSISPWGRKSVLS